MTAQATGRRVTAPASRPHADPGEPARAARRRVKGRRSHSTRSPSRDSNAGSVVTAATTAIATTTIAPMPIEANMPPATSIPDIATTTVRPETTTARPAVAPAMPIESRTDAPAARSSRARRSTKSA